jgi:hypothetical protein
MFLIYSVICEQEQRPANESNPGAVNIEDSLGVIGVDVICTLYGDEGREVLRMLLQFPQAVIPTILAMLARKEAEVY